MRVGVLCFSTVGGSGIIAAEVGLALARRGHSVHFFCKDRPWRFDDALVTFHREDALGALPLDVLHVHYAVPHAVLARRAYPATPLVVTLHGTDVTKLLPTPDVREAVASAMVVTVPSRFLQQAAHIVYGLDRIEVIPNFVDSDRFVPGPLPRPPVLFHASNFRPVKRVADVVRIFAGLRRKRPCTLRIAGDGPDRAEVELLARGLDVEVEFLGARHDVDMLLRDARVFLLPSESESFGVAALEAQSAGVPVVGSAVGGLGEVVCDGVTGFLRPVGHVAAMVAAAEQLLDDDRMLAAFSDAARAQALRFSARASVDAYERVLSQATRATA